MNEKELIVNFIEKLDNEKWRGIIPNYDAIDEWVDEYLKEIHKEYYEVEFKKKEEHQFDEDLGPDLIVTDDEGKAIGVLEQGVNTLYSKQGKVIGWSNLTAEELRKMYNEVNK